jgi:DNA modification methylase
MTSPARLSYQLSEPDLTGRALLTELLSGDLDFHQSDGGYASHNLHSFPAKFPPQLPRKFIEGLTTPGDLVLDPMNGSGTTILEAVLLGRRAIGCDIDPLALRIGQGKVTPLDPARLYNWGEKITTGARWQTLEHEEGLRQALAARWDADTLDFVDTWFTPEIQIELLALLNEIQAIPETQVRNFFLIILSSIVITKSGGVSLALDLAHTRPHMAKVVLGTRGEVIRGGDYQNVNANKKRILTKRLRSPISEFEKKYRAALKTLAKPAQFLAKANMTAGNAQALPLAAASVDLIVTSPPYAGNAIDYMRAHKFSLVWLGHKIKGLGSHRNQYIGSEATNGRDFADLPTFTSGKVQAIAQKDAKKSLVLHRYYTEMTAVLREMHRVLKPGKAAIVVVGSTVMRGLDTETQLCLAEIGTSLGLEVPHIGVRQLDRNRRMLPAGMKIDQDSQIQQRMHQEFVIGFLKPA